MIKKNDDDPGLEGFVDLLKLLDENLEGDEPLLSKKKLSLDDHFREVIEEAELFEKETIRIKAAEEEFYENFNKHARKTRGRRRRLRILPATLISIAGGILNSFPSSLTLTGTLFGSAAVIVRFSGGGISATVPVVPTSDTQVTVPVPISIYSLDAWTVVSITVINGCLIPSNALTTQVQPPS